jgi:hypothetical protein
MILHGLYHFIATKRASAGAEARAARRPECDPRISYEKSVTAEKLAMEAEKLSEHAKGNEELLENLNHLIHYLATSEHKSRYRSLVLTDLESAQNWLRRENGDREPERKFETVEETNAEMLK